MIPPTHEQARMLAAIHKLSIGGVSPSYRELGAVLGISIGNVHRLLVALKDRGQVEFESRSRSLRIVSTAERGLKDLSTEELIALRDRVDAILIGRWKP